MTSFDKSVFEMEVAVSGIQYLRVNPGSVLPSDRLGFARVYREAFAGEPWYETYTDAEVLIDVWDTHINSGAIVLARDGGKVVGLGCAQPLTKASPDVQEFLASASSFTADPAATWYMSELAVDDAYRRQGIGKELVRHRLLVASHQRATHFTFRTAIHGSNSLRLYRELGADELAERQDMSHNNQVLVNGSHSTERVYMHGEINKILRRF
ncbi:MAG TPA: GNAT family N-acetyltransferase [Nitrososphaera sp.]|nr:GNAT family N-acetyltransferase [Nitrososphaera sp.]